MQAAWEVEAWKARDAIALMEAVGITHGFATAEDFAAVRDEVLADVVDAIQFAEASPHPDPADILLNVYSG